MLSSPINELKVHENVSDLTQLVKLGYAAFAKLENLSMCGDADALQQLDNRTGTSTL
jgi:hypothetical protein